MSVVIETTQGDITVDLFLSERPRACLNFLKLCKIKYYNYNLFHTISRGFIAQTGDPTGSRSGGESVFGILDGPLKRYFEGENEPRIKHTKMGLISFVGNEERMIGSQFFLTLGEDLTYLDEKHCVFGEVVEGFDILEIINEVICDTDDRPYQDVRITHTVILDDPYPDPKRLVVPSRSPSPSAERLQGGRIAPDEEVDEMEGKTIEEVTELQAEREAKARATILEMVGDLPDADMAPPENVLFVCKLNPVTNDDDLEIIFSRFGKIKSCEVIRDKKTGDSLQYAFVEFEDQKACEEAYFKMDNVLIDDRRIHVDFSQSVSKVRWHGKGRGVTHYDEKGNETRNNNDIGKGNYQHKKNANYSKKSESKRNKRSPEGTRNRSRSPSNYRGNPRKPTGSVRSPVRDTNKYSDHSRYKRDNRSPPRRRDFISPESSETRSGSSKVHKYLTESEDGSKRNKDRSSSSKSRSPSQSKHKDNSRTSRNISSSPEREQSASKNYTNNKERYRDKSKSPKRIRDRKDRYYNESQKYVASGSKKVSSDDMEKRYSRERKTDRREIPILKDKRKLENIRSHSDRGGDATKHKYKKKKSESSGSSDSDNDKKGKTQKNSSESSESDKSEEKKLKKKKDVKKSRYESSSDSDDFKGKKSKKKKKK